MENLYYNRIGERALKCCVSDNGNPIPIGSFAKLGSETCAFFNDIYTAYILFHLHTGEAYWAGDSRQPYGRLSKHYHDFKHGKNSIYLQAWVNSIGEENLGLIVLVYNSKESYENFHKKVEDRLMTAFNTYSKGNINKSNGTKFKSNRGRKPNILFICSAFGDEKMTAKDWVSFFGYEFNEQAVRNSANGVCRKGIHVIGHQNLHFTKVN